jgi:hypothetical protein
MREIKNTIDGYVALTTVLVVSAVIVVIVLSISILSVSSVQTSLSSKKSSESLDIVDACGELVLKEIRSNPSFNETTITLPEGTCNLQITENSGEYTIIIDTEVEGYTKSITIEATRNATGVILNSWRE